MRSRISFFSNPYAKSDATAFNPLNRMLYDLAYPLSRLLATLRMTPNQITGLSSLLAVAAFAALAGGLPASVFAMFWGLSLILDFCDGTVARMRNQVSRSAFRFDHMSDLAKISLVTIGAGIRYDDVTTWVLSSVAVFSFMYYSVLNQELKGARGKPAIPLPSSPAAIAPETEIGNGFQSRLPLPLRIVYTTLATINGHTLLAFIALPFGRVWAECVMAYLIAVSALGIVVRIRRLMRLPKP